MVILAKCTALVIELNFNVEQHPSSPLMTKVKNSDIISKRLCQSL
jgi:hypothetical protein